MSTPSVKKTNKRKSSSVQEEEHVDKKSKKDDKKEKEDNEKEKKEKVKEDKKKEQEEDSVPALTSTEAGIISTMAYPSDKYVHNEHPNPFYEYVRVKEKTSKAPYFVMIANFCNGDDCSWGKTVMAKYVFFLPTVYVLFIIAMDE